MVISCQVQEEFVKRKSLNERPTTERGAWQPALKTNKKDGNTYLQRP